MEGGNELVDLEQNFLKWSFFQHDLNVNTVENLENSTRSKITMTKHPSDVVNMFFCTGSVQLPNWMFFFTPQRLTFSPQKSFFEMIVTRSLRCRRQLQPPGTAFSGGPIWVIWNSNRTSSRRLPHC